MVDDTFGGPWTEQERFRFGIHAAGLSQEFYGAWGRLTNTPPELLERAFEIIQDHALKKMKEDGVWAKNSKRRGSRSKSESRSAT